MTALRVTVPCSTSNLGAGFDCIGLAFARHLTVTFTPGDEMRVTRTGTLEDLEDDDIVASILAAQGMPGTLLLDSNIPVGKGLGSSASATVAALTIAGALRGEPLEYDELLQAASSIEGHPDNAAPVIVGGLVAVVLDADHQRIVQLHLSHEIAFVFAAPNAMVSTRAARKALPDQVPHRAATRTIARTVALVEGLAEADPDLLRIGFGDELHVPYRLAMIPGGTHALDAALRAGAWAATISGSGSGMVAACARGDEQTVLDAMIGAFEAATAESSFGFIVEPDFTGVQIEKLA